MKNKRVLIAETSKTISRILAEALKEAGYSINECTDGIEALKLHYKENYDIILATSGERGIQKAIDMQPDLILLEYEMPGMNGNATFEML